MLMMYFAGKEDNKVSRTLAGYHVTRTVLTSTIQAAKDKVIGAQKTLVELEFDPDPSAPRTQRLLQLAQNDLRNIQTTIAENESKLAELEAEIHRLDGHESQYDRAIMSRFRNSAALESITRNMITSGPRKAPRSSCFPWMRMRTWTAGYVPHRIGRRNQTDCHKQPKRKKTA